MGEASAAGGAGRLVTGEAVELGLHPAKLPSRALAAALDGVVYIGGYLVVSIVLVVATASMDGAAVAAVYVTSLVLVLFGVPIAVETLTRGGRWGSWPAGCGWCGTTAGRSGSGTRWCAGRSGWSRSRCSSG